MARAHTVTKLPLDEWARQMGVHPLHFNQVGMGDADGICDRAWFTHEWQDSDRVGREAVAFAIATAEDQLEHALGFRLVPSWEVDEWRPTSRGPRPELVNVNGRNILGKRQSVQADWGYFVQPGIEAKTLINASAAVVYAETVAELDDIAYDETATVGVTVAEGTDPCEVAVYYPGKNGADEWEIRPISVSIVDTTATIMFRRELAIEEELLEAFDPEEVDGTVDANFLDTVDVYRHWNDPSTQATLMWEPTSACVCSSGCTFTTQSACLYSRDNPRLGILGYSPATYDAATGLFTTSSFTGCMQPDIVRLYYQAGWRNRRLPCARTMDPDFARIVSIFAAAMLDRAPCGCTALEERINRWRKDLAFSSGSEELSSYQLSKADLDNPFGTRAGAVYAWKQVNRRALAIGRAAVLA